MRFQIWCLIGCVGSMYGISTNGVHLDDAQRTADSLWISYKYRITSYYFEHGAAEGSCYHSVGKKIKITIDGNDVTEEVRNGYSDQDMQFKIPLNRQTELGDYLCHSDKIYPLHRISYILCDPNKLAPSEVCPDGHVCVIDGNSTICQRKLECEGVRRSVECLSGRPANMNNGSCHVNNIAHKISNDYYLQKEHGYCVPDPRAIHNGNVVTYLSTLPISSSRELAQDTWNSTCKYRGGLKCDMLGKGYRMKFNGSDFTAAWDGGLPSKQLVRCECEYSAYTIFHILFYGKHRTRFIIVQNSTNFTADSTNNTNLELLLDPTAPFNCSVSIEGELFVEAFSMEVSSADQPKLGSDSVEMKYNGDLSAPYTCFAKVYYYEQFGGNGFRSLYLEKRDFTIYHSTIATKGTTWADTQQSISTGSTASGSSAVLIGICVGVALGVAILIVVVLLGIRAYRKKAKQSKEKQENVRFRSVRAPETDRFQSMTTERSASIVSASGLQPGQGTGLTSLFYKAKPASRKRTGSQGTAISHMRRSSQGLETRRPSASRRGTGTIEAKLNRDRAGSHGTASGHRRRSSQGATVGGPEHSQKRAGSIEPNTESASVI